MLLTKRQQKGDAGFSLCSVKKKKKKGARSIILALTERPWCFAQEQDRVDPQQIFLKGQLDIQALISPA